MIEIDNRKFELIKDERNAFDLEEFERLYTDYFYDYDYIVGDIAYGKLRLKGFYDEKSKKVKNLNNFKNVSKYVDNSQKILYNYK